MSKESTETDVNATGPAETPTSAAGVAGEVTDGVGTQVEPTPVALPTPTPEEIAALKERAEQADGLKERLLRSVADLENFRKRAARERQEAVQYANQSMLERLIPALDNLDMASVAMSSSQGTSVEAMKTGVEMVLAQLKSIVKESGLEEISATGQAFDPTWHEAVSEVETTEVPEGHVVQQLRKGYRLHQRLLRPTSVVVARQPKAS